MAFLTCISTLNAGTVSPSRVPLAVAFSVAVPSVFRVVRVGFLQQNAFHAEDTYVPLEKQMKMMEVILYLYHKCQEIVARQVPISKIMQTGLFDKLVKMKYDIPNDKLDLFDSYKAEIDQALKGFLK